MDHPEGIACPNPCNRAADLIFFRDKMGYFLRDKNLKKYSLDIQGIFWGFDFWPISIISSHLVYLTWSSNAPLSLMSLFLLIGVVRTSYKLRIENIKPQQPKTAPIKGVLL